MSVTNYTELQARVANELDRDDLASRIPEWIVECEARLNRELRCPEMETTSSLTQTAGVCPLPANYLEYLSVTIAGKGELKPLSAGQANSFFGGSPPSGTPRYFSADKATSTLRVYPTSSDAVDVRMYVALPPLASSTTNWLLTKYPEVYIYGSLLPSASYLLDDARIATWGTLLDKSLSEIAGKMTGSRWGVASRTEKRVEPS
ncbi:hypothetical protein [Chelatococcus sp. YT9]|uniref:phage adaptor protein n=1 Tax=Chelatococcus sp. YT9 TaxID=2835635 RepID=UPI001BCDD68C|nr:hypothetical protein [Chelatococcus sp. YT9]MBS7698595.1 hypothetical protein [Chelatococcus sp. YT9]